MVLHFLLGEGAGGRKIFACVDIASPCFFTFMVKRNTFKIYPYIYISMLKYLFLKIL
jgi:hypothetical protein